MRHLAKECLVWVALLVLLSLTVLASFVLTGPLSLAVSLLIASLKAALVYWFFMNLRDSPALVRLVAVAVFAWIVILAVLAGGDFAMRGHFGS